MSLTAQTSSTERDANDDRPIAVDTVWSGFSGFWMFELAAARATATSPSGSTACTPVGEMTTGKSISCPSTVVFWSRCGGRSAMCGRKPSSSNAATLSESVMPCSAPATSA